MQMLEKEGKGADRNLGIQRKKNCSKRDWELYQKLLVRIFHIKMWRDKNLRLIMKLLMIRMISQEKETVLWLHLRQQLELKLQQVVVEMLREDALN